MAEDVSEISENELKCLWVTFPEQCCQLFSTDAIYQAAASGCTDDLRDIMLLCDDLTRMQMLEWTDEYERTALVVATQEGHYECMKLLLAEGANVDHMCRYIPGGTALHIAVFCRRGRKIIKELLLHGADPFVENNLGVTPWDISLLTRHSSSVEFSSLGMFEGLFYIKNLTVLSSSYSKVFWVRIVPRHGCPEYPGERLHVGSRLCIHWRLLGETVCEIDLEGCRAELIPETEGRMSNVLLACPTDRVLSYNSKVLGGSCNGQVTALWIRGQKKLLNEIVDIVNNTEPSIQQSEPDEDDNDEESIFLESETSSSWDEFSLSDISTVDSSLVTTSLQSSEAVLPIGLAGAKPLVCSKKETKESKGLSKVDIPSQKKEPCVSPRTSNDNNLCIICLDRPKSVGFVHGKSMHICSCEECAELVLQTSNRCPLCRKTIQHVVTEIY